MQIIGVCGVRLTGVYIPCIQQSRTNERDNKKSYWELWLAAARAIYSFVDRIVGLFEIFESLQ